MSPCPPPLDCVDATLNEQGLHSAPLSLPPASASTPTSGAVGASGNCRYGKSPALKFRLQRSPSSRRRPPSSCFMHALSISKCSLSSAVSITFTNIPSTCLFRQTSSRSSKFLCRLRSGQYPYAPWDASAWVEIPLSLVGAIVAY